MKLRKILAVIPLTVGNYAYAQSSVALYGIISVGVDYVSNEGGKSNYKMVTGALQNNRWGIRITEDLGGGNSAVATLENGFDVTTGKAQQGGRMFGRQAWVGLRNQTYGTITAGRQYDMFWDYLSQFAAPAAANGLAAHPGDSDNLMGSWRYSNSVKYASPTFHGINFEALYAFSNAAGEFALNRAFSAGVGWYALGTVSIAAAFTQVDRPGTTNPNGAVSDDFTGAPFFLYRTSPVNSSVGVKTLRNFGAGASWAMTDKVSLSFLVDNDHYFYLDGTGLSLTNADVSISYRVRPSLFLGAAYVYSAGRYGGLDANPHWNEGQLSVDYFLSKRTDVFIYGTVQRVSGPHAVADIYLHAPSTSQIQSVVMVGMRHKF